MCGLTAALACGPAAPARLPRSHPPATGLVQRPKTVIRIDHQFTAPGSQVLAACAARHSSAMQTGMNAPLPGRARLPGSTVYCIVTPARNALERSVHPVSRHLNLSGMHQIKGSRSPTSCRLRRHELTGVAAPRGARARARALL